MEEPQLAADEANKISAEMDEYTRSNRRTNATLQREHIEIRMQQLEKSEITLKDFRERNRRVLDSPQLMLEQERLARDVQACPEVLYFGVNSTIFIELKKQFEVAKIEEIKNIPIINVLDAARPPVKKSYPNRAVASATVFLLALVVSIGYVAYKERGRKILRTLHDVIEGQRPMAKLSVGSGSGQEEK